MKLGVVVANSDIVRLVIDAGMRVRLMDGRLAKDSNQEQSLVRVPTAARVKDVSWGTSLELVRERARELRRPIVIKPLNQGGAGDQWCPAASYTRAIALADPRVATLIEDRFVPMVVSLQLVGDYQDAAARELVFCNHASSPFPEGVMVFEPDELRLLTKTRFDQSAEETLAVLMKVLADHPELASGAPLVAAEPYDPDNPVHAKLLDLEKRLEHAGEGEARELALAAERWLGEHGPNAPEAAPLAWLLRGEAWYLGGEFQRANAAWRELTERLPDHPLRQRAAYNMLSQGTWPEPPLPSLRRARRAETGVKVPFPEVRERNLLTVRTASHYWWSPSGIPFVVIPAGTYIMGANPPGAMREHRLRRVTMSRPFLLAAWPVTRAVWRRVYPDDFPGIESEGLAGELPATMLSWQMAADFIEALRGQDAWPYRFPTEAQWEYAARDGIEGAPYPWGFEPLDETRCNFNLPGPVPVACYPPTRSGLFDMLGNTAEFTSDLWLLDGYSRTSYEVTDPCGPTPEEQPSGDRVTVSSLCGPEFWKIHTRISWRSACPMDFVSGALSLRLACDLPE
jgi:formylglycine-generating enzyme